MLSDMLTPRLHDTLGFIRDYIAQHGYAPLLSAIRLCNGIQSRGALPPHLQMLRRGGPNHILPGKPRGIRLLESEHAPF